MCSYQTILLVALSVIWPIVYVHLFSNWRSGHDDSTTQTCSPSPSKSSPPNIVYPYPIPSHNSVFCHPVREVKGVFCIALNRPSTRNAISVEMLQGLENCIEQALSEPSLQVLIFYSAAPNCFCAGVDLIERRTMSHEAVNQFLTDLRRVFKMIDNLPFPTICAIDGPAMGGGLELAMSCDFRIAEQNVSKISFPETKLGVIPGAGGTQRTPRLIGLTKAKELIFTGRALTAVEAHQLGLVDYLACPPTSTAYERSLQLAREISKSAPLALRAAKVAMNRGAECHTLDEALDVERLCYEPLLDTKDRVEALDAFKEKREPHFTGL